MLGRIQHSGQNVVDALKMRLKGMETRKNLAEIRTPQTLLKDAGRVHLDRYRRDLAHSSGRECVHFESAFSNAPIGMVLMDMNGRWLHINSALCRITGHTESELKATSLRSLTHHDDIDLDVPLFRQLLDGEISSYQVEKRCLHAWGQFVWMMITVSLVRNEEGRALNLIMQFQDISERREMVGRLEYLAVHDYLTGLYNRRHFEQELAHEVDRAARYGSPGAILIIDVDNFKNINDTFGHLAGDDLLKEIAGLLKHRMRHTDILARIGGDEFAVLLPHTNATQSKTVADDFVKVLDKQVAMLANESIRITASVGVASFDGISAEEVFMRADAAMYGAKQAGRNRFLVYQPFAGGGIQKTTRCSEADWMRKSLEEDLFLLYCQPIRDLKTNEISQYELLLRLTGSEGCKPLAPNSFLYVAERFGVILAIDRWVVCKAIAMIREYEQSGRRLTLNVNLSGKSIGDPKLAGSIEDALAEGGIDPSCLVFELTEEAAITNLQQARAFADQMHRCGCRLALDNFGAGLSSFYYLTNFPFDDLKIDGAFIRYLSTHPVDHLVVKAIVSIAQGMGKKTIAEFVTDAHAVRLLRDSGVDYAQGYHIGMPQPVTEYLQHSL
jgi:diguanylate cyclase (GGDEF)-like protein/PAS domain S-box-containing protein